MRLEDLFGRLGEIPRPTVKVRMKKFCANQFEFSRPKCHSFAAVFDWRFAREKIFVLGVALSVLFVAQSAFAMTFQQPVKVGEFGWNFRGGFVVKGSVENNGDVYRTDGRGEKFYGKGIARFGDSNDSLYAHYNQYQKRNTIANLGARNESNAIEFDFGAGDVCKIYKIATNELGNLYILEGGGMTMFENFYIVLLGRKNDGTWVKYFDTEDLHKRYFAQRFGYWFNDFKIHDNAISIQYRRIFSGRQISRDYADEYGEFRFKWDDKAQWFSVAQIVY